jgi:hypothetical protein
VVAGDVIGLALGEEAAGEHVGIPPGFERGVGIQYSSGTQVVCTPRKLSSAML